MREKVCWNGKIKLIFLVRKERLKEEYGIKDKESFLEFLNGILYTDIIAAYPHIKLISNELIEKEFLKEILIVYHHHLGD